MYAAHSLAATVSKPVAERAGGLRWAPCGPASAKDTVLQTPAVGHTMPVLDLPCLSSEATYLQACRNFTMTATGCPQQVPFEQH